MPSWTRVCDMLTSLCWQLSPALGVLGCRVLKGKES